jgi:transposase
MTRRQKEPLRALREDEKGELERLSRARSAPAAEVVRARMLLAVAEGKSYADAARSVGRRSGDAVSRLVGRFNREGLIAVVSRHGGGPRVIYGAQERERILAEFRRSPDREQDGTATWSLSTLQRALRHAPDGLPHVSTQTILKVLWDHGWTWQKDRTWCQTGQVRRKRGGEVVEVTDPDAGAKKG